MENACSRKFGPLFFVRARSKRTKLNGITNCSLERKPGCRRNRKQVTKVTNCIPLSRSTHTLRCRCSVLFFSAALCVLGWCPLSWHVRLQCRRSAQARLAVFSLTPSRCFFSLDSKPPLAFGFVPRLAQVRSVVGEMSSVTFRGLGSCRVHLFLRVADAPLFVAQVSSCAILQFSGAVQQSRLFLVFAVRWYIHRPPRSARSLYRGNTVRSESIGAHQRRGSLNRYLHQFR